MFLAEFVWALIIAVLLAAVFTLGFRRGSPGAEILFFFVLLFFITWAGGVWIPPLGPLAWGVPWLSFLLVGVLVLLLLAAVAAPVRPPRTREEAAARVEARAEAAVALNAFFWVLLLFLIAALALRYWFR